jgi:Flp pilus assembly protein TadD
MQDAKRDILFFCSWHRIAIAVVMSVILAGLVRTQDPRGQRECENLLNAAARAEETKDTIEAEFRYEECRELAQKYRLPKMEASALHRLAVIRAKNKKFTESANLFRRSLELDPKNALALCDFAQLHADRKDYDEAEKLLKKALDADPNNPKILFNLGIIIASQRSERQTEGLRYLKLAVGEVEAYRELARICRANGDISRAELADQKAQLAESQGLSAMADTSDSRPARLPQRAPHQPQTPPEIVNRVRQEVIDTETREIIGAREQQAVMSPVAQMPFIPAPVNPTPGKTGASPQQQSPASPVDPFASVVQRQAPATSSVRQLEVPPTATFAQTTIRTLPSHADSASVAPSSDTNGIPDPFAPVQIAESVPTNAGSPESESQSHLIRISRPVKTEEKSSQPLRSPFSDTPKKGAPSIRILPTIQGSSNKAKPAERMEASNTEKGSSDVGNPLRSTLLGSGMLDVATDVSAIASLPSYSAVGTKKIPRIDQNNVQGGSPNETESPQLAQPNGMIALETAREAKKTEVAQMQRPLPVRDANVQQSPSTAVVRRELPMIQSPVSASDIEGRTIAHSPSSASVPATSDSEYAKIIANDRRFTSTNAPEVLKFSGSVVNQSPTEKPPLEVAVKPLIQNDSRQGARPVVRLPQIATGDSDNPMTASINTAPDAPSIVLVHPSPTMEQQPTITGAQTLAVAPTDPFPVMAEQKTIVIQSPTLVAVAPGNPPPVMNHAPQYTEVKNMETQTSVLSDLTAVAAVPADPFSVAMNNPTKFTEVRKIEPQTIALYHPAPIADVPSTAPMLEYSPTLAEAKKPESLSRVSPLPMETTKVAEVKTLPSLSAPVQELPKPLPGMMESPTGFASTRKSGPRVAVSDDQSTGFARSRK